MNLNQHTLNLVAQAARGTDLVALERMSVVVSYQCIFFA
jgi:hypothetical protein